MKKTEANKILSQNGKMKATAQKLGVKIYNFNIPAFKSATKKITCPFALNDGSEKDCVKFCYAQNGNYKRFAKTINPALERRYALTKTDQFVPTLIDAIETLNADFIRIHDSGDFYHPAYVQKWFAIAQALPKVKFYAYTKSHNFFRGVAIPENFDIIFSEGSKLDGQLNKETERHASIFQTADELKRAGYIDASKTDLYATKFYSKNHKIGLVYH